MSPFVVCIGSGTSHAPRSAVNCNFNMALSLVLHQQKKRDRCVRTLVPEGHHLQCVSGYSRRASQYCTFNVTLEKCVKTHAALQQGRDDSSALGTGAHLAPIILSRSTGIVDRCLLAHVYACYFEQIHHACWKTLLQSKSEWVTTLSRHGPPLRTCPSKRPLLPSSWRCPGSKFSRTAAASFDNPCRFCERVEGLKRSPFLRRGDVGVWRRGKLRLPLSCAGGNTWSRKWVRPLFGSTLARLQECWNKRPSQLQHALTRVGCNCV